MSSGAISISFSSIAFGISMTLVLLPCPCQNLVNLDKSALKYSLSASIQFRKTLNSSILLCQPEALSFSDPLNDILFSSWSSKMPTFWWKIPFLSTTPASMGSPFSSRTIATLILSFFFATIQPNA